MMDDYIDGFRPLGQKLQIAAGIFFLFVCGIVAFGILGMTHLDAVMRFAGRLIP